MAKKSAKTREGTLGGPRVSTLRLRCTPPTSRIDGDIFPAQA